VTAKAIINERRRMRRKGFRGRAGEVIASIRDSRSHSLRIVLYAFTGGPPQPFIELWESHDRARRAKIVPLSELVHVIQNLSESEFWAIAARKKPGRALP
jgi:hypothetical protein